MGPITEFRKILTENATILEQKTNKQKTTKKQKTNKKTKTKNKQRKNKQKLPILEALHIRNIQPKFNRINFEISANALKCL